MFVSIFAYWESTRTLVMGEESELRTVLAPPLPPQLQIIEYIKK